MSDPQRFLTNLSQAVQIATVSYDRPGEVEPEALARLHRFLSDAYPGVWSHLDREVVGDHTLILRWQGSRPERPPILLMAHLDVVPVEKGSEARWPHPPFSGHQDESHLWGRGALDMKAGLIGILETVETLVSEGFRPGRSLYLVFGHDEEVGGLHGAAEAARLLAERGTRFEFVLDEGGFVLEGFLPGVDPPLASVAVGERGYLNVELVAQAESGHSSAPSSPTAIGRLARAIDRIERRPMPARLETSRATFQAVADHASPPWDRAYRAVPRLGPFSERLLATRPATNTLIRTTWATTLIEGGHKVNALPTRARAVLNVRILPGDTVTSVLDQLRSVAGEGIEVRPLEGSVVVEPPPLADAGGPGFRLIADAIEAAYPGTPAIPTVSPGLTDSRHFVSIADAVYRFLPFRVRPDDLPRLHGDGERVRLDDAGPALIFYRTLIESACG